MSLKVKALARGYYGNLLRREGDVFTLERGEDFSRNWMVKVMPNTPERHTSAQGALSAYCNESLPAGFRIVPPHEQGRVIVD